MHVISLKKLREFWAEYPDAEGPLRAWHREAEHTDWESFAALRRRFPHADMVGRFVVFNIGGNKYRLITAVHFDRRRVYVRRVLTHADYDTGDWKSG